MKFGMGIHGIQIISTLVGIQATFKWQNFYQMRIFEFCWTCRKPQVRQVKESFEVDIFKRVCSIIYVSCWTLPLDGFKYPEN